MGERKEIPYLISVLSQLLKRMCSSSRYHVVAVRLIISHFAYIYCCHVLPSLCLLPLLFLWSFFHLSCGFLHFLPVSLFLRPCSSVSALFDNLSFRPCVHLIRIYYFIQLGKPQFKFILFRVPFLLYLYELF